MRPFNLAAFALAVSLGGTALAADDKANAADLKAMVGKWKIEKTILSGKDITDVIKDAKFEIMEGGKYTLEFGPEKDAGTFTVDATKKLREMDVKPTGGPLKGKLVKAIYKLDGDTLTMCYDHDAGDRPKAFESKEGTNLLFLVYKREKK